MAHDVFISYAAEDRTVTNAVCAKLEAERIRCWIAPRDVLPGVSYAEALVDAISESSLMVLVFSSRSNNSPQVMREVERAASKGIPILPFRIEDVAPSKTMEFFLSTPHWLDALTPPLEKHLGHLAGTVQMLLSRIRKPEEGTEKAESVESGRAVGTTIEKGPHRPPPARKALEFGVVVRWGGRPIVRLAAVFLAVAGVVALILLLVGWPFGGGDGGPTPTSVTPELGTYTGITSQGRSVEFDVIEGGEAIIRIKIEVEGECPLPTPGVGPQPTGCTCNVNRETRMTKPWPIGDTGFSYAPGDFEFSAVFNSTTTATGFVRVHTSGTGGQASCSSDQVTWTASLQ